MKYISAYCLKPGSPLIDGGFNLSDFRIDSGDRDFYGTPIPVGKDVDIGAVEIIDAK